MKFHREKSPISAGQKVAYVGASQMILFLFAILIFSFFSLTSEEGVRIGSWCVRDKNEEERRAARNLFPKGRCLVFTKA